VWPKLRPDLESQRAPVEILVIDHAEKPAENETAGELGRTAD